MINRILKKSTQIVFNDGIAALSEHSCTTITFGDLPEKTKKRLLSLNYSPPLLLGSNYYSSKMTYRLIGGETVCYCKHLFFSFYQVKS